MEKKPDEPCYRVIDREYPDNFLDIAGDARPDSFMTISPGEFHDQLNGCRDQGRWGPWAATGPFAGAEDIGHKTVRMTGGEAFVSDPLRILRAVRFSAGLGFTIEPDTLEEMKNSTALLHGVSGERVMAELLLILKTPHSVLFIREWTGSGFWMPCSRRYSR